MKNKLYIVEFSDEDSRTVNDMPYRLDVTASSSQEAKRKVLKQLKGRFGKSVYGRKIKIEGVFSF